MVDTSGFVVTYLLAAPVKESHRVYPILNSGAYNGYPIENDWRESPIAGHKLEGGV